MENVVTIKLDEVEIKRNVDPVDREKYPVSPYAQWFDENCAAWTKDPEQNKLYILRQQDYANEKLKARGYLFLNEVYELFGIPKTKVGQVVGWVFNPENPTGDNYVDFGIFDVHNKEFFDCRSNSILLDFNVDGMILDQF